MEKITNENLENIKHCLNFGKADFMYLFETCEDEVPIGYELATKLNSYLYSYNIPVLPTNTFKEVLAMIQEIDKPHRTDILGVFIMLLSDSLIQLASFHFPVNSNQLKEYMVLELFHETIFTLI